jgi:hypothetical protein
MPKESYRNTKTTPKESSQHPGQGKKMALTIGTLLSSQTTTAHCYATSNPAGTVSGQPARLYTLWGRVEAP